jgi:hypothetical protein
MTSFLLVTLVLSCLASFSMLESVRHEGDHGAATVA